MGLICDQRKSNAFRETKQARSRPRSWRSFARGRPVFYPPRKQRRWIWENCWRPPRATLTTSPYSHSLPSQRSVRFFSRFFFLPLTRSTNSLPVLINERCNFPLARRDGTHTGFLSASLRRHLPRERVHRGRPSPFTRFL